MAAALLLRLGLAAAGWADVAFTLPPDLIGISTYQPVSWTAEQVEGMRRRALLQQAAGGGPSLGADGSGSKLALPVCELGLSYRIVELQGGNFTSVVTLQNNREVSSWAWATELTMPVEAKCHGCTAARQGGRARLLAPWLSCCGRHGHAVLHHYLPAAAGPGTLADCVALLRLPDCGPAAHPGGHCSLAGLLQRRAHPAGGHIHLGRRAGG